MFVQETIDAFGPLQDSMLIRPEVLPLLVRATAVQANRKVQQRQLVISFDNDSGFGHRSGLHKWTSSSRSPLVSSYYKNYINVIIHFRRFDVHMLNLTLPNTPFLFETARAFALHILFQASPAKFLSGIVPDISAADSLSRRD